MTDGTGKTARGIFIEWANQRDSWVRTIASELLATRVPLSDGSLAEVRDRLYAEKALAGSADIPAPMLSDSEMSPESRKTLVLTSLFDCRNVNRLAAEQRIDFGKKLTILFGENASGKTGYVRVLKRVSGVRGAATVLPDIERSDAGNPSATLAFTSDGVQQEVEWSNERGLAPLDRVTIFDSPAVSVHLNDSLEYVFTPADLALFELVHVSVNSIRQLVQDDISYRRPGRNRFTDLFTAGTESHALVEALDAETDLVQLAASARDTEADREQVRQLLARVDALRPETGKSTLRLLRTRKDAALNGLTVLTTLSQFDVDRHVLKAHALSAAEMALADGAQAVNPGEGPADEWQRFLSAAEAYTRVTFNAEYPDSGDWCLFCRQALDVEAVELIRQYRDFAAGGLHGTVSALRLEVTESFKKIADLNVTRATASLNATGDDGLALAEFDARVREVFEGGAALQQQGAVGVNADDAARIVQLATEVGTELEEIHRRLEEDIRLATSSNTEREEALAIAEKELAERADQQKLAKNLNEISEWVKAENWCSRADEVLRKFQGVLRTLTDASKDASQQALQHNFRELFEVERSALRAPAVQLNFQGRQGKTMRSKSVSAEHGLEDVLSEGEQKVIALADFLAESLLRPGNSPVVFDDPVNSLDYRRLNEVVDRLVLLSERQQVIIFTHNIWFAAELLAKIGSVAEDYRYYDIQGTATEKGFVSAAVGPRTDRIKATRRKIADLILAAEGLTGDVRQSIVEQGYENLRNFCEMFVEHELLGGVTERYSAHVGVTRVSGLKFDRLETASRIVVPIYEKCCREIPSHSQPLETLNRRATLDDLKADWKTVWDARSEFIK